MQANLSELEKKLWSAADELRANSELKSSEYSVPVLGLIFLRYADVKFANAQKEIGASGSARVRSITPPRGFFTSLKPRVSLPCSTCRKVPISVRRSMKRWG